MAPVHQVASQLSRNNIVVDDIELIEQKERESGWVYRVVGTRATGEQATFYVRTISDSVAANAKRVLQTDPALGMPDMEILDDELSLLVMDSAHGRPLSVLLPVLTLPGVWLLNRTQLRRGIRSFGRSLGALHTSTEQGQTTLETAKSIDHIAAFDGLEQELGSAERHRIEQLWSEFATKETTVGMSHKDPSPHNIYYASGTTELIDIAFKERICVRDIARAEMGLELMIDRLPYGKSNQKRQLIKSFRRGYITHGGPVFDGDERTLYQVVKLNQLCYLLSRYTNKSGMSVRNKATKMTDVPILKKRITTTRERIENGV